MNHPTADAVFQDFRKLTKKERARFYELLSENSLSDEDLSHEQVFGHLSGAEFTAAEAAQYLDVSMSTFRRYVSASKIRATSQIGRSDMFATADLKAFKRSLREVKGV
ncbi:MULTISPECIES: helix-turn-helix domain-containing protein [unclassified Massilia]|uniref:helix-turn-helix domain-containing protein n=1 Tax=unclassified Massilia TaxID=2609279 RepID=UPI00177D2256|nr:MULTISPECIES: helix-turn-helix domain-containing protein [unclassified Massilia]MBD8529150.1 helix-turn-helix domain-containing protein [Massilia sp. CFBP 13647]MBD8672544.1 helix-turn-helix domain-containing protein [Massilia sp. CFBP 13721]